MAEGIEIRHAKQCRSQEGKRCNCEPSYRASVWSRRDRKLVRRTFATQAAAKRWRRQAAAAVDAGTITASAPTTLATAAQEFLEKARAGVIHNRSGDPYKPAAIRAYDQNLRRVGILQDEAAAIGRWPFVPEGLGRRRLADVRRRDLQDLVEALKAGGLAPSTVTSALLPVRVIYRRALQRGEVQINPTVGLALPAVRRSEIRVASPSEAADLLSVLSTSDAPLWATAMFAGLRRGELKALAWKNVDLAGGRIRVVSGWDDVEGEIPPKSREGRRVVPVTPALRGILRAHRLRQGRGGEGYVFGLAADHPFGYTNVRKRAISAWTGCGLQPITMHECRHSFASYMIAAGVNAKALSRYMGHASIVITLDLYGHLMPGNEDEAADLLDAYLARSDAGARLAALPSGAST
jgi:integrase